MKRWKDPFPPTPEGFHDRVEQTLRGLEDVHMDKKRYKKLTALLVAALIALLAVGAAALMAGNARFKQALTDGGADEVAALVQEARVSSTGDADGFALSIDEIIWEDDLLYFSYTASVPDDGNRYLMALYTPQINGEPMEFYATGWEASAFFDDEAQTVIPMGGPHPAACGQLLTCKVDPELRQRAANALALRADFFKTDFDFASTVNSFESAFKGAVPTVDLTLGHWQPLEEYADQMELPAAETQVRRAIQDAAGDDGILTPEELSGTEHFEAAATREARMALDASKLAQTVYDGVEETEFALEDWNGCTLAVEGFHMTHLGARIDLRVTAPAGLSEEEGMRLVDNIVSPQKEDEAYYWGFFRPDGTELALDSGWELGAGYQPLPDGTVSYLMKIDLHGIIPLEGLEKVILMPFWYHTDDYGVTTRKFMKDWAVELTPVLSRSQADAEPVRTLSPDEQAAFDAAMNGEAMTLLERRIAAANWQEGDPTFTVYATDKGTYYHLDVKCSGMRNPHAWAIGDAVAAGKLPCPDCAGGKPDPAQWEAGEDICC